MPHAEAHATDYLPGERAEPGELEASIAALASNPIVDALIEHQPGAIAVVNGQRQIVALNTSFLAFTGHCRPEAVLGLRPGEAVHCAFSGLGPGGCGTGRACASCGAAVAMLVALKSGQPSERECALSCRATEGEALDLVFQVHATPVRLGTRDFLVLHFVDRTAEKRRKALEDSFFHDLNNVLMALVATATAMCEGELVAELAEDVRTLTMRLTREVQLHKALARSGASTISLRLESVSLDELRLDLSKLFARHPAAEGRALDFHGSPGAGTLVTDRSLVQRVLTNLVLNAVEASRPGGTVRVSMVIGSSSARFSVWNQEAIPAAVAPRIFQRFFSTKGGNARGQGTFAVKLLVERYLGGRVGFTSSAVEGTTFWVDLPMD